jgi:hypothetical protein
VLDRERILGKLDELDGYQRELTQIVPAMHAEYLVSLHAALRTRQSEFHVREASLPVGFPASQPGSPRRFGLPNLARWR